MARMRPKYGTDARGCKYLKYYYAEFYDPNRRPRRKRISLRTTDEMAARHKFVQLEREHMAGLFDPWADRHDDEAVTVREAVRRFVESRKEHCSDATVETYDYVLGSFADSLAPGFPLIGIEQRHLAAFLDSRRRTARTPDGKGSIEQPIAEATRRSYIDRLRILFVWCTGEGLLKDNPVPTVRRSKKSRLKSLPEYLTETEYTRLLRAIEADAMMKDLPHGNQWLLDALRFAVGTGLRRGELLNLRWSAVDLPGRMLMVKNTEDFQTKSGRERSVPLVGDALRVVQRLHTERTSEADTYVFISATGGKINGNYLSKRFREYRRLVTLPEHIHLHSLRHTFASWFVLRGGDLYRLKEILGHSDMKTTLQYAHLRPDALRHEMELCFGDGHKAPTSEVERLRQELEEARAALDLLKTAA